MSIINKMNFVILIPLIAISISYAKLTKEEEIELEEQINYLISTMDVTEWTKADNLFSQDILNMKAKIAFSGYTNLQYLINKYRENIHKPSSTTLAQLDGFYMRAYNALRGAVDGLRKKIDTSRDRGLFPIENVKVSLEISDSFAELYSTRLYELKNQLAEYSDSLTDHKRISEQVYILMDNLEVSINNSATRLKKFNLLPNERNLLKSRAHLYSNLLKKVEELLQM